MCSVGVGLSKHGYVKMTPKKAQVLVLGIFHNRRCGANRPWRTMPGIFVGYNFLKAHPIPFKMTLVSTLTVGAFGRSGLLNALRT